MVIVDSAEFIRDLVSSLTKNKDMNDSLEGTICLSQLFLLTLGGIFYHVDLTGKIDSSYTCGFNKSDLYNYDYINDNDEVKEHVMRAAHMIFDKSKPIEFDCPNLRNDEIFETMINSKSDAGAIRYFFIKNSTGSKSFIILHKGIFNLNKPDKIALQIFNSGNNTLMAKFNIYKKKINLNYEMYMHFMDFT